MIASVRRPYALRGEHGITLWDRLHRTGNSGVTIVGPITAALAIVSAIALIRLRLNSAWLALFGAIVGL